MHLFRSGLFDELIEHTLEIALGMGFQFRAEGLGGRPILAQNVLADSLEILQPVRFICDIMIHAILRQRKCRKTLP